MRSPVDRIWYLFLEDANEGSRNSCSGRHLSLHRNIQSIRYLVAKLASSAHTRVLIGWGQAEWSQASICWELRKGGPRRLSRAHECLRVNRREEDTPIGLACSRSAEVERTMRMACWVS